MWFMFTLSTALAWGAADLFYKKGANELDQFSHLKTAMMVGLVMGLHAICMLIFTDMNYDFRNILVYLPVSLLYILSMTIGYFGLRYLELSISSPIQNSSGAVTCLLCFIFLGQRMDFLSAIAVTFICTGIFLLGIFEKAKQKDEETLKSTLKNKEILETQVEPKVEKGLSASDYKYKIGFVAFLMPIFYCIIDALGTFFDAYYLDDIATTPLLNVTEATFENVANTSYELTFLICGIIIFLFLHFVKKENIIANQQKDRIIAASFETIGQFTYVYAMSGMAIIAAPMIASYSIVSILFSRIFLREKLYRKQYFVIGLVLLGIILLGVVEAL